MACMAGAWRAHTSSKHGSRASCPRTQGQCGPMWDWQGQIDTWLCCRLFSPVSVDTGIL